MAQQDLASLSGVAPPPETSTPSTNFTVPTAPTQPLLPYSTTPTGSTPAEPGKPPNSFLESIPAFSLKKETLFDRSELGARQGH